ncbi:replication restart helicase PriA [Candidatus Palauibacter sp.]|uniref:replication restart helicase PriA n=1 Tax=Candidatus Palauibacter sp. TaxID=3101350 RepID=UPI003B029FA2
MAKNKQPGRSVSSNLPSNPPGGESDNDRSRVAARAVSSAGVCEVAVARTFLGTLAYSIPASLVGAVTPGVRVRVPLGGGVEVGVVDRMGLREDRTRRPRLRDLRAVLDETPVVDAAVLELCRWIADYYVAPLGAVLKAALPPGLLVGRSGRDASPRARTERVLKLVRDLKTLTERERLFGRAHRQRELYETLEAAGGQAAVRHLTKQHGFARSVLNGIVTRGVAEVVEREVERDPFGGPVEPERPITLTPAQERVVAALERLGAVGGGEVALLRGVTGSGKTVIYLDVLERQLARGRSGIFLVPEIALTPQMVRRFRARFGDAVAVLHSGLSRGERFDAWRGLREGRKRIAIGPRSAVFAPVRRLGAIIVDEEHESSYKQSDVPRYHARSVAVMRARIEGGLCVLGSATPALESWANAREGRYHLLELEERVTRHGLPAVELVDLRADAEDEAPADAGRRIFSPRLRDAIDARLERGEQTILFLNRRGYASFAECAACGHVWSCDACSVTLTYHRRRRQLVCHHCGSTAAPPDQCDNCGAPTPRYAGVGTEQVERRVGELFPSAGLARMDLDTTGSKWAHAEILEAFRRREVDILLGTQMIAKGLDFPHVTLVGVINADVGLHLPDFRASERTFQLLEQVAGRAGRGDTPGEVLIQTSRPGHYALSAAAAHDYVGFASRELGDRREPGYPPHRRLANLVVSGTDESRVVDAAEELSEWTLTLIRDRRLEGIDVIGPAPCPIDRLRKRWRWHFLLKADRAGTLGGVLRFLGERRGQPGSGLRLEIDRDPEALL